jgi:hypothetical protein
MHEVTGMSIRDLRDLMGDRRTKYRLSDAQGRPKPTEDKTQAASGSSAANNPQAAPAGEASQQNQGGTSGNYAH